MSHSKKRFVLAVDERELATILAGLRFHQDENLHSHSDIADQAIKEIATNSGLLRCLDFNEINQLCERINTCEQVGIRSTQVNCSGASPPLGLTIVPPPEEKAEEPLFRVVYVIDVNAGDAHAAAEYTHRIMTDPHSMLPVLQVIDHKGKTLSVDLSENQNHTPKENQDG